jgi:hypothetical protein
LSTYIPVSQFRVSGGYILELLVADPYEIIVHLLTDTDPTLVDTNHVLLATDHIIRGANVDEGSGDVIEESIEPIRNFVLRAHAEAIEWASEEIERQKEMQEIADEFESFLKSV